MNTRKLDEAQERIERRERTKNIHRCPSCGAIVVAGVTPQGKMVVLDAESEGIYHAVRAGHAYPGHAMIIRAGGGTAYLDHRRICKGDQDGSCQALFTWIEEATREVEITFREERAGWDE